MVPAVRALATIRPMFTRSVLPPDARARDPSRYGVRPRHESLTSASSSAASVQAPTSSGAMARSAGGGWTIRMPPRRQGPMRRDRGGRRGWTVDAWCGRRRPESCCRRPAAHRCRSRRPHPRVSSSSSVGQVEDRLRAERRPRRAWRPARRCRSTRQSSPPLRDGRRRSRRSRMSRSREMSSRIVAPPSSREALRKGAPQIARGTFTIVRSGSRGARAARIRTDDDPSILDGTWPEWRPLLAPRPRPPRLSSCAAPAGPGRRGSTRGRDAPAAADRVATSSETAESSASCVRLSRTRVARRTRGDLCGEGRGGTQRAIEHRGGGGHGASRSSAMRAAVKRITAPSRRRRGRGRPDASDRLVIRIRRFPPSGSVTTTRAAASRASSRHRPRARGPHRHLPRRSGAGLARSHHRPRRRRRGTTDDRDPAASMVGSSSRPRGAVPRHDGPGGVASN